MESIYGQGINYEVSTSKIECEKSSGYKVKLVFHTAEVAKVEIPSDIYVSYPTNVQIVKDIPCNWVFSTFLYIFLKEKKKDKQTNLPVELESENIP